MHLRRSICLVAACVLAFAAAAEDKRVALVIGNSAYLKIQSLNNPKNDATDVASALKRMGYEVVSGTDLDRKSIRALVDDFNMKIRGADIALFYYSGHGVQVDGENYLVPVSADVGVAGDISEECVSLTRITARMSEAGAKTNVIILDACRDNPFKAVTRGIERGLAVVGQKPPESIIVYATAENEKAEDGSGRNGVFTKALLANLERQEALTDILLDVSAQVRDATGNRQKPAVYQNLTRRVYLAGVKPAAAPLVPPAASPPAASGAAAATAPTMSITRPVGTLTVSVATEGSLYLDGAAMGQVPAGAMAKLDSVDVGDRSVELRYADGQVEKRSAQVAAGKATTVSFSYSKSRASLVAWYKFDETEGKVAADSSGNGRDGSLVAGGTWVAGKVGNALSLNGGMQYVRLPDGITSYMKEFTIAVWLKLDRNDLWARVFDFGKNDSSYLMFSTQTDLNGLRFAITKGTWSGEQQLDVARTIRSKQWTHVAVTLAGRQAILYLDGKEVGRINTVTIDPTMIQSTNNFLGKSQYGNDPCLSGALDDFRIYGKALGAQEIASIYAEAAQAK
jgi:uncharacterized caspase-like protein